MYFLWFRKFSYWLWNISEYSHYLKTNWQVKILEDNWGHTFGVISIWVGWNSGHSSPKGLPCFIKVSKRISQVTFYFVLENERKKEMFPLSLKAIPISQQLSAAQCTPPRLWQLGQCLFIINQLKRMGSLPRPWDAQQTKLILVLQSLCLHTFLFLHSRSLSWEEATCPF